MFRNLRLYRLDGDWPESEQELSDRLAEAAFEPCGAYTAQRSGWEPPAGDADPLLCRRVGGADLMRLRTQSRLLPAAAINEALDERIKDFRARTQRDPARREKRELKDEVQSELMPRALLKSERTAGFFLHSERLVGIDTASESKAEAFLNELRAGLGTLPVTPLTFRKPVGALLTQIFLGDGPETFAPGRECRMQDPTDGGAYVHWSDMQLTDNSVRKHVRDGLKIDRLAIEFDAVVGCVLDQQGVIRKLRLRGQESIEEVADESPLARLDADFVLLTGTLRRLITALKTILGGYGTAT